MELKATKKTCLETRLKRGMPSLTQPMSVMVVTVTILKKKNTEKTTTTVEEVNEPSTSRGRECGSDYPERKKVEEVNEPSTPRGRECASDYRGGKKHC